MKRTKQPLLKSKSKSSPKEEIKRGKKMVADKKKVKKVFSAARPKRKDYQREPTSVM